MLFVQRHLKQTFGILELRRIGSSMSRVLGDMSGDV
jgi:hypothetical protein